MENEKQLEVLRQTVSALNAQNERLKAENARLSQELARQKELENLDSRKIHEKYVEMDGYCKEAMHYRDELKRLVIEAGAMKTKHIEQIEELAASLF